MDFVILKVNGKDVSNVAHEEMVQAFELADEPIVIEVARRAAAGTSAAVATVAAADAAAATPRPEQREQQQQPPDANNKKGAGWVAAPAGFERPVISASMSSVATQTDEIFGSGRHSSPAVEAARPVRAAEPPSPPPLTAFEWPQHRLSPTAGVGELGRTCRDDDTDKAPTADGDGSNSAAGGLEQEDAEELLYLTITLRRQSITDRVGLTLCYGPADPETGCTDVFIGEVDPDGIAGCSSALKEGDQVLQINGEDVCSRESAVRLFSSSTKCLSLLVCRSQSLLWAEDDGFAEEHGDALADSSTCPASSDLRAIGAAAALEKDSREGRNCDFAMVARAPRQRDNGQDMPFDIGQCHELLGDDCFGTEACLSTCGEEDEDEEDAAQAARGHEISEEHCRRFMHALQLKCEAMRVQPLSAAADAATAQAPVSPSSSTSCQQMPARPPKLRLGTVPLATASVASSSPQSSSAAGAAAAAQQRSVTDGRLPWQSATDDSSCHDTAYNTAESCRSSSIAAHELPSQAVYRSSSGTSSSGGGGGASPRLHADRCRATRSPAAHEEARARVRADGRSSKQDSKQAATAVTGASSQQPGMEPRAAAEAARSSCHRGSSSAYANRHTLAQVIAAQQQQQLLEERLAAAAASAAACSRDAEKHRGGSSRAASKSIGDSRPISPAAASFERARAIAVTTAATSVAGSGGSSSSQPHEWVVKVRSDGSRYITRRPARTRLLKDRQRRLEDERCGLTTDDDAASELKLGRRWSHAERRRHLESAREHRRRKELARLAVASQQQQRAGFVGGDSTADGRAAATAADLLELRERKQLRQQLADIDFTTVQELLVHGSRSGAAAALAGRVLLSVTTV